MIIKEERLIKFQNFLNEIRVHLQNNFNEMKYMDYKGICHKHKLPYSVFPAAIACDFFVEIKKGNYKCNIGYFEPLHARKVVVKYRNKIKESAKKRFLKPKLTVKETTKPIKTENLNFQQFKKPTPTLMFDLTQLKTACYLYFDTFMNDYKKDGFLDPAKTEAWFNKKYKS